MLTTVPGNAPQLILRRIWSKNCDSLDDPGIKYAMLYGSNHVSHAYANHSNTQFLQVHWLQIVTYFDNIQD